MITYNNNGREQYASCATSMPDGQTAGAVEARERWERHW